MTPTQAYYLDYAINGLFWGTWLGMFSIAVDTVADWIWGK